MKNVKMSQITVAAAIVVALLLAWTATVPAQISSNSAQLIGGLPCSCQNTTSDGYCDSDGSSMGCTSYKNKAIGIGDGTPTSQWYCAGVAGCSQTLGSYCKQ